MLGKLSCNVGNIYPTINVMSSVSTENHWKQFGQWIRKMRKAAGLTQVQVSSGAEITDVQLARIEKGESGTKRDTAISIIEAINHKSNTGHKVDLNEARERFYGRWNENNQTEIADDELVSNGIFSGYYNLTEEQRKLARKQIAAIIRSFNDEDFED